MRIDLCQRVCGQLRELYDSYGYNLYTMSKFEEYDLYANNRDFLISGQVITFTDLNGSLMALKPDVTLSIVKNTADGQGLQKLYYQESVYRAPKGSGSFREILQVGLECLGDVDDFTLSEVLSLAAQSLSTVSERSVLDVSDLSILEKLMDRMLITGENRVTALALVGEKNRHELMRLCADLGVSREDGQLLCDLLTLRGEPAVVLPKLKTMLGEAFAQQISRLERILTGAGQNKALQLDFSVVDDPHYYNGLVFKGFIDGIPVAVLSGGQYDKLIKKMKRTASAVGFAIYMDMLERLEENAADYDVDTLLLYGADATPEQVRRAAEALRTEGKRVLALAKIPEQLRYRQIVNLEEFSC